MEMHEPVTLKRGVEAITIPDGGKISLPEGSLVIVSQSLGGSFTVSTDIGVLARIAGKDADALGLPVPPGAAGPGALDPSTIDAQKLSTLVWDQLRTCYDPEIPVNMVDLGLIYEMKVAPLEGGGFDVYVKMTLTAPGCGMGDILKADAQSKIAALPAVKTAAVEVVFDPVWNQGMMSEAARLQLGML
jgi:probable FeS assembly SUF system protein SufT